MSLEERDLKIELENNQERDSEKKHDADDDDDDIDSDDDQAGGNDKAVAQDDGKKLTRAEKKCKKAFLKIGMKPVPGIIRVTLKRRDKIVLYVDNPEILKSGTSENAFVILGELKMQEQGGSTGIGEAQKFKKEHSHEHPHSHSHDDAKKQASTQVPVASEGAKVEEVGEDQDQTGVEANNIEMVMQHANCSRAQAVRALKESDNDLVQAVLRVSNS